MSMRTDQEYLNFDPFAGEEGELTLHRVELRTARKPHECFLSKAHGALHMIEPGQRYRHEQALVDGDYFGRYAMCLPCIDQELREFEGESDDD